jgi:hypothetical protein
MAGTIGDKAWMALREEVSKNGFVTPADRSFISPLRFSHT